MRESTEIELTDKIKIHKTSFITKDLPASMSKGMQIGDGKCKAVILRLNEYVLNDTAGTQNAQRQIYYGDESNQRFELLRGKNSEIIFCTDLAQVYVRNPYNTVAYVEAIIYY